MAGLCYDAWGWDALLVSDRTFLQDYNPRLSQYRVTDPLQTGLSEGKSQLYLTGRGSRSSSKKIRDSASS